MLLGISSVCRVDILLAPRPWAHITEVTLSLTLYPALCPRGAQYDYSMDGGSFLAVIGRTSCMTPHLLTHIPPWRVERGHLCLPILHEAQQWCCSCPAPRLYRATLSKRTWDLHLVLHSTAEENQWILHSPNWATAIIFCISAHTDRQKQARLFIQLHILCF